MKKEKKEKQFRPEKVTLSTNDKLNLIGNLGTMLTAGLPILSAIHSLSEEARGNTKKILDHIYEDLLRGKQLNVAFAAFPLVFDKVTLNMIRASEQVGKLDIVLENIKEEIKKEAALNRKIKNAMTYPILVLVVFIAVLTMILTVVIPKIATVFSQLKVKMPLPTKILIFMSNMLLHYTLYVIGGLVLVSALAVLLYKKQKRKLLPFFYSLPVISQLVKEIDLLHFTRSLHLMMSAGITITAGLEQAEQVVIKRDVAKAISDAKNAVLTGKSLSHSFKQNRKIFPGTMIELIQAGEKTGTLDRSLDSLSQYFEYKVADTLTLLTTLMEPILLVIVAILVGSMMVAIIGPIYSIIGQIGQGPTH